MRSLSSILALALLLSPVLLAQNSQVNSTIEYVYPDQSAPGEIVHENVSPVMSHHSKVMQTTKHHVATGETLYGISRQYGVSVNQIKEINPFIEGFNLNIDDVILIPNRQAGSTQRVAHAGPGSGYSQVERSATSANAGYSDRGQVTYSSRAISSGNGNVGEITSYPIGAPPHTANTSSTFQGQTPPTHVLRKGETLFSVAKFYGLEVDYLKSINKFDEAGVNEDQMIFLRNLHIHSRTSLMREHEQRLAYERDPMAREKELVEKIDYSKMEPVVHVTERGETLYALSRKYNHSVSTLKKWNNMTGDRLKKGQELVIGWIIPDRPSISESEAVVDRAVFDQMTQFETRYNAIGDNPGKSLIAGKGVATWMRGEHDQNLYCLHKSVPPMTILKVTNPMNSKSIFVKVISELPPTSANENVEMKLTGAAVKKLNLLDKKFLLEYSYYE